MHRLILVVCAVLLSLPLAAQEDVVITVTAPEWIASIVEDALDDFNAQHPGITAVFAYMDQDPFFAPPAYEPDTFFEGYDAYASTADVLYLQWPLASPEATRAGYLLDLSPLASTDPELNPDDFYPAAYQSFQWDNGLWGLPVSAEPSFIAYDPAAFDAAGLPYPDGSWSLTQLLDAAEALATRDDDGNLTLPGLGGFDAGPLFVSTTGENVYDEAALPTVPDFSSPALVDFVRAWRDYQDGSDFSGGYSFSDLPMVVGGPWSLNSGSFSGTAFEPALLPGGRAGLRVEGYGVSSGTRYPMEAYTLVRWLSSSPELVLSLPGSTPARRSLEGVTLDDEAFFAPQLDADDQAFVQMALENAIPISETRFFDYTFQAMGMEDFDLATALEEAERQAIAQLEAASARQPQIVVDAPELAPAFDPATEVALVFGLSGGPGEREQWQQFADEFVAAHPRVAHVDLKTQIYGPQGMDPDIDCFYTSGVGLSSVVGEPPPYLPVGPFLAADPTVDNADYLPGVLDQLSVDNALLAVPLDMSPVVMWYNSDIFARAGVAEPTGGWDVSAFADALPRLQSAMQTPDEPALQDQSFGGTYLDMLIAAYGGIAYDDRTTPATLNLTDPATVEAVRQVLDLARAGLIDYRELAAFGGSGGGGGGGEEPPLVGSVFRADDFRLQQRSQNEYFAGLRLTTFPAGSQHTPVTYQVGAGVILEASTEQQECYDFISALAQRPDMLQGMPVRRSQIDDPAVAARFGDDVAATFRAFGAMLDAPDALLVPVSPGGNARTPGGWMEHWWVYKAYDNYVLADGDLNAELAAAEANILEFRECTAGFDLPQGEFKSINESRAYYKDFADCAVAITPERRQEFMWIYES